MLLGSYRDSKGQAELGRLWAQVIMAKSHRCQMCGEAQATDPAHYIGKSIDITRWHPDNGNPLCRVPCHRRYDHEWDKWRRDEWKAHVDGWDTVYALKRLAHQDGLGLWSAMVDTDAVHAELVRRLENGL